MKQKMTVTVHDLEGKTHDSFDLPEEVFGLGWNADLVKQVADSLLSSRRKPVAHTKDRSEVRGGGKKPWRQKGTGRARHGSSRSPIWVGGGVTGGPRKEKVFKRLVPRQIRLKALYTLLSRKFRDGEVLFVKSLKPGEPKTKEALKILKAASGITGFKSVLSKKKNATLLAFAGKKKEVEKAFANFGNVGVLESRNLDPISLLKYKYLVIEDPEKSLMILPGRSSKAK